MYIMLYSTKPKSSNHKMHGFHMRLFPEATDQVTSMVIRFSTTTCLFGARGGAPC